MRRIFLISLCLLFSAVATSADGFQPFDGPAPEFVWLQSNPWLEVIGSDTPAVVLYDSGQIIYVKQDNDTYQYRSCILNEKQLSEFRQKINALYAVKSLKSWYSLVRGSDQPISSFYMKPTATSAAVVTEAYGLSYPEPRSLARARAQHDPSLQEAPTELMVLPEYLSKLDFPDCPVWRPKYIEVMIWPFDYAKEVGATWPSDWPGLASDRTLKRGD